MSPIYTIYSKIIYFRQFKSWRYSLDTKFICIKECLSIFSKSNNLYTKLSPDLLFKNIFLKVSILTLMSCLLRKVSAFRSSTYLLFAIFLSNSFNLTLSYSLSRIISESRGHQGIIQLLRMLRVINKNLNFSALSRSSLLTVYRLTLYK